MLSRRAVPWLALLLSAVVLGAACGGGSTRTPSPTPGTVTQLDPAAFRDAIASDAGFVVNVHIPYEGNIPRTDAFIPYDAVEGRAAELPQDKGAPLYVYCRSGRMSAEAIPVLQRLGYTNIIELRGGMDAWRQAGFTIETTAGGRSS